MHASNFRQFSDIGVSQGSLAIRLRCGGIVNDDFVAYLIVNLSVKMKIDQHLAKLWTVLQWIFLAHSVLTSIAMNCQLYVELTLAPC